ncbi:MAG: DUF2007 domain-containing protein [Terricaulis sp.]
MRQAYAPANSAEAHMLAHMLDQNGIEAHIHGEALQGGVGELPAAGLLQLMVADEDYDRARALISAWERASVASTDSTGEKRRVPIWMGLIVFAMGVGGGWVLREAAKQNMIPIDAQQWGSDDNGDGVDDVTNYARVGANFAYRTEIDRNFDGRIDDVVQYNANGTTTHEETDDDFDGFFETKTRFRDGNVAVTTIDLDRDGKVDRTLYYVRSILDREEVIDDDAERVVATNFYEGLRLSRSEHDLDGDGFAETLRTYDAFGEIAGTETRLRR